MTDVPPAANLRGAVDLSSLVRPAPSGEAPQVPSLVLDATESTFSTVLELSNRVPVIVELYARTPSDALSRLVTERRGRLVLARVDAATSPQLVQAFQAQSLPTVAAIVGGRPIGLYLGEPAEADVRQVLDQVLALAAQNGVTGTVEVPEGEERQDEPEPEPLPPHHQEAYEAIERGDYEAAIKEYQTAIAQNPRDGLAVAGLAQVSLLSRLQGVDAEEVRRAGAAQPEDPDAQLTVADLDLAGGHVEDAFDRLLTLFPMAGPEKDRLRTRLLDYFEIVGAEDPRVIAARRRLAALLY